MSACLQVDLGALQANYRQLCAAVAPGACGATVKADAYGLGIELVAPALYQAGCREFFTATAAEALQLAGLLPDARVYLFEGVFADSAELLAAAGVIPVLNHPGQLADWRRAARRLGRVLPAALHVDTGMTRLGMPVELAAATLRAAASQADVRVDLLMTHLACADQPQHPLNSRQADTFAALAMQFPQLRTSIANSAAALGESHLHGGLARPGIALYGANPFADGRPNPMQCVAQFSASVLQVRELDAPASVGYGASEHAAPGARLATVGVGYADGYPRSLGGRGRVILNDRSVRVVGRVSMDLIVLELGDCPAEVGDQVELFGARLPVDQVAGWAGTIAYELLVGISRRVRRAARAAPAA